MSFDEQPDGDIHGECAAEIHRLEQELTIERGRSFVLCLKLMEKSSEKVQLTNQLDACRTYLKDGETAAEALERLSKRDSEWISFAMTVGMGVGCLASAFPDDNDHIIAAIEKARAANEAATCLATTKETA